jgi:hypothetical protein
MFRFAYILGVYCCLAFTTSAQVHINGLSRWPDQQLQIKRLDDYFSGHETLLTSVTTDSLGLFQCTIQVQQIERISIRGQYFYTWFYAQPLQNYTIELPDAEAYVSGIGNEQEVELLFYKLDTNDINYKILTFEAWMDEYIADIYQLRDIRSNEFILKVREFKGETERLYGNETNEFLRDYIKYSVGITVDNFSVIGGPTRSDKFEFYLKNDSLNYKQPKQVEYARLFYDQYAYQLELNLRKKAEDALLHVSAPELVSALVQDPFIANQEWAEFVAFQLICEQESMQRISRDVAKDLYFQLQQLSRLPAHQQLASYLIARMSTLQVGAKCPNIEFDAQHSLFNYKGNYVYLHFYQPGNQKCIAELNALKHLQANFGSKLHIITIYPKEKAFTKADERAFEGAKWDRYAIASDERIWQLFKIAAMPSYVVLDDLLYVSSMPALGPTPNGRGDTIERFLMSVIEVH